MMQCSTQPNTGCFHQAKLHAPGPLDAVSTARLETWHAYKHAASIDLPNSPHKYHTVASPQSQLDFAKSFLLRVAPGQLPLAHLIVGHAKIISQPDEARPAQEGHSHEERQVFQCKGGSLIDGLGCWPWFWRPRKPTRHEQRVGE